MSNKFRQVRGQQPPPKPRQEQPAGDLEGFRSDKSGALLPLTTAAIAEHVRIQKGELTKDVGWSQLGEPLGLIIGLYEHKWQFGGQLYARILRILNEDGVTRSQWWDGTEWVEGPQASEPMEDVYLSEVSIQGCFVVADGQRIMKWCEEILTREIGHDFEPGLLLNGGDTTGDCTGEVIISPALAVNSVYVIHLAVIWDNMPTDQEGVVEILIKHNGFQISKRYIRYSPPSMIFDPVNGDEASVPEAETIDERNITFRRALEAGDTIEICVGPESTMVEEDYLDIQMFEASPDGPFFSLAAPGGVSSYRSSSIVHFQWTNTVADAAIQVWKSAGGSPFPGDVAGIPSGVFELVPGTTDWDTGSAYYDFPVGQYGAVRYHRGNEYSYWVPLWGAP